MGKFESPSPALLMYKRLWMTAESENWTPHSSGYFLEAIWHQCVVYVTVTKKNVTISTKKVVKCITEPFQTTISFT